jgi:hypothetical protein
MNNLVYLMHKRGGYCYPVQTAISRITASHGLLFCCLGGIQWRASGGAARKDSGWLRTWQQWVERCTTLQEEEEAQRQALELEYDACAAEWTVPWAVPTDAQRLWFWMIGCVFNFRR